MKDFHSRKKQKRNLFYHPLAFVVIFLVLIFLLFSVSSSYRKKQNAQIEYHKIEIREIELIKEYNFYKDAIKELKTEEGIKNQYKKNNDYGEKGVKVIKIIDSS